MVRALCEYEEDEEMGEVAMRDEQNDCDAPGEKANDDLAVGESNIAESENNNQWECFY